MAYPVQQAVDAGVLVEQQPREGCDGLGQRGVEPPLHARRGHRPRGVDAHPAPFLEPHLGPGVGVALAHHQVAVERVDLAPLVARDDPRGHARGAHQNGEGAGVVLAEALARPEEKLVHRVAQQQRGVEGIHERLLAEEQERPRHAGLGVRAPGEPPPRERDGVRVGPGGQLQGEPALALAERGQPVAGGRGGLVAHALAHGSRREELQVATDLGPGWWLDGRVQGVEPAPAVGLQRHLVARGRALGEDLGGRLLPPFARAPAPAVGRPEHRAAPVELVPGGLRAGEAHAEGHLVGQPEPTDEPGAHGVVEAAAGGVGVGGQRPQGAGQAGEEHEERHRHGARLQQQGARQAQLAADGPGRSGGQGQGGERGRQQGERGREIEAGRDRLGVEQVGDHEEVPEQDPHEGVPAAVGLHQLQAAEGDQQGHPGVAPEHLAVARVHTDGHGQREREPHRPSRRRGAPRELRQAPQREGEKQRRGPERDAPGVR